MNLIDILNKVDVFIWGLFLLVLLVGIGILFIVKFGVV